MAVLSKTEKRPVTGEELFRRPGLEPFELVEGRIVPSERADHGVRPGRFLPRPFPA